MHSIYVLKRNNQPFYVGWTRKSNPQERLYEHILDAVEPTEEKEIRRLVTGGPSPKDQMILDAIDQNDILELEVVITAKDTEPLDEEEYIQFYRRTYQLTNQAKGTLHQPSEPTKKEQKSIDKIRARLLRVDDQEQKDKELIEMRLKAIRARKK